MTFWHLDERLDNYNMLGRLQLATAVGIGVMLLYALQFARSGGFLRIFGVGMLTAGGFLLMGFLLGFIFAIPRMAAAKSEVEKGGVSAKEGASQASAEGDTGRTTATATVETNSNLVEISDWLTKILVGVSLVEMNKIPGRLKDLTAYLGAGLRNCGDAPVAGWCVQSSESFALGIIIFFFTAGFLIGYLWTRLYLQRALGELSSRADRVDKSWESTYLAELRLRDGSVGEANSFIDKALAANPMNSGALLTKGRVLKRMAQAEGKPGNKQLLEQALKYVSQSAALKPEQAAPAYNIACYQALLGKDQGEILNNLKRAFQLDSRLKQTALADEDLASLREVPEFTDLTVDKRQV
jgi:hypothetical protein